MVLALVDFKGEPYFPYRSSPVLKHMEFGDALFSTRNGTMAIYWVERLRIEL